MAEIKKLSPEIIGQIAAGEVVERPASAVKELVENSIDAGAKNVTVELREGGVKYLRVSDNGKGIPAGQLRMAFERHATSKLTAAADLYNIHTLGFRGEALASIAAVAKVTCTTRTQDAAFGTRAVVDAGEFVDIRQAASPVGTTFVVEDLFHNTPVRLKFLKKPAMEGSLVADYMLRLILSHPEVAFRFVNQGKTVYHSTGDGSVESALFCLYGREPFKQMKKVRGNANGVLLSGYVGVGELARGNRQQQSFFVNGRYFRSVLLSRALEDACEGRVMIGKFPMCALFLEIPYQQVDVNVHPNKLEVRFQNEAAVADAVATVVREALTGETLGEKLKPAREQSADPGALPKKDFTVVKLPNEAEDAARQLDAARASLPQSPMLRESRVPVGTVSRQTPIVSAWNLNVGERAAVGETGKPAGGAVGENGRASAERERLERTYDAVNAGAGMAGAAVTTGANASARLTERVEGRAAADRELGRNGIGEGTARSPQAAAHPNADGQATGATANLNLEAQSPQATDSPKQPNAAGHPPQAAAHPNAETQPPEQTTFPEVAQPQAALRLVGIVFDTYWIFETPERLLLLDQHAAHERMLYDRMMARFEGERISQRLLSPQLVRLTAHDRALAEELREVLSEAGFEVEPFDESCVAIHAIPTLFGENEPPRELLLEALDEWQSGRGQVTRERMRRRVAQMACKRAIKGGDRLSRQEAEGFLREMLQSESMPTCPHGRPIVTEITRYALEKRFKRIQ